MTRLVSPKHNGTSAGRMIVVLAISTGVLLTGAAHGHTSIKADVGGGTISASSVYGPSRLTGPLLDASVSATTATTQTAVADVVTFSVGGPSHLKGPLK